MAEPGVAGTILEVSGSLELAMEHPTITSLDFPLRNYLKTKSLVFSFIFDFSNP